MKKTLVSAALVGLALRLAAMAGAGETLADWAQEKLSDGALISATIDLEFGGALDTVEVEGAAEEEAGTVTETVLVAVKNQSEDEAMNVGEQQTASVEVTTIVSEVDIRNDTSIEVDAHVLMAEGPDLRLQAGQPQILIIHTHGSEAYTMEGNDVYEESDPYRTEDCEYNVIKVGDVLAEKLESYGLEVIHDRGIYDYPSYTGSYSRSGAAVEDYLEQYPSIGIVIDLHRDALGSGDVVYKTKAEVDGKSSAQVMLLVGTGENGLAHPLWQENLKLALMMQSAMDETYPTLARPLALKSERYNQHLTTGSLILEVGSTGNTLDEAVCAIELFADAVGPELAEMIVNE